MSFIRLIFYFLAKRQGFLQQISAWDHDGSLQSGLWSCQSLRAESELFFRIGKVGFECRSCFLNVHGSECFKILRLTLN